MTEYLYFHPFEQRWCRSTPPAMSRTAAVVSLMTRIPHLMSGLTCPVLTERNGIPIPESNSKVEFHIKDGRVHHDERQLTQARIK